ncbi:hypothetical protein HYPSUDRAFT_72791 [Hypholoma sublateritium FD-334 SS-4]|uniref:RWD domain-containing protein n=1 Tax=Hypholoma sublateritium (strain FD-334 SS-4) TaxID=945553 RepID=A0A0D2KH83_HYPSF|nr:hypothetical protein HYPSUDRAFT_72791 [Hypholoma sublateritium FD-334 SS-4]
MSDALLEEFEVLESIYPTELHRISEHDIEIEAEADDIPDGCHNVQVTLCVHYSEDYPNVLPKLSLLHKDENIDDNDVENLLTDLRIVGEENLGMAMTFTLVSQLREQLSQLVRTKQEDETRKAHEKERLLLEEEEKRTRGTPVTVESFKSWKGAFDQEMARKKRQEEDERLKGLTPKEREEWKRSQTRLSGRQLFERNKIVEDETLLEEGTVSVDFSQYERTIEEEEANEGLEFSDSD